MHMEEQQLLIPDALVDSFLEFCLGIVSQERLDAMIGGPSIWRHGTITNQEMGLQDAPYYVIQWNWLADTEGGGKDIYETLTIEGILKNPDPGRSSWMPIIGFTPDPEPDPGE